MMIFQKLYFRCVLRPRFTKHIAPIIQFCLGESASRATQIAQKSCDEAFASRQIWRLGAEATLDQALVKADQIPKHDCQKLYCFFSRRTCGVLLTTIHMGDFLHAILQLAGCLDRDEIFIVRQRAPDDIEARVFAKLDGIGVRATAIRSYEKKSAIQVMRALRKGSIVVALFDLPESYGSSTTVRFCGHQLKWVGAPALLAQRTKSILLPFVSFRSPDGGYRCDVLEAYDFSNPTSSPMNPQQLSQILCDIAEHYVKRYPEQWLQWPMFPEMLANSGLQAE